MENIIEENKVYDRKIFLKDELIRLKQIERLELNYELLAGYQEHLGKSKKEYLSSFEAVDYYQQLVPFLIKEIENKKIALDNMRSEKKDLSSLLPQTQGMVKTFPQEIKDILKKIETGGYNSQNLDKLKKQLFQRDIAGRITKTLPELYSAIIDFFMIEIDKGRVFTDKNEIDKKSMREQAPDEHPDRDISIDDIEERFKRLETCDVDIPKFIEFKKKLLKKKITGEPSYSPSEISLKLFDFLEQEYKRNKGKWIRDKKLEATVDSMVKSAGEKPLSDKSERFLSSDVNERIKKMEGLNISNEEIGVLKLELNKRNSNGNLVYSPVEICNRILDFYEKLLKIHNKELEFMEQFKDKGEVSLSQDIMSNLNPDNYREEIEKIKEELLKREKLASEYFARSQRIELDLKRLRSQRDKAMHESKNLSNEKLVNRLLVVLDDMERAFKSSNESFNQKALLEGMELINRRLISTLQKEGLKVIDAVGKEFDPKIHEAFEKVETDEYPEDTVVEVLRNGYWLGPKLLRPSLVKVAKALLK